MDNYFQILTETNFFYTMKKRKASVINHSENRELNTDDQFLNAMGQTAFPMKDFFSFVSVELESLVDLAELLVAHARRIELDLCGDGSRARLADEALERPQAADDRVLKQIGQIF